MEEWLGLNAVFKLIEDRFGRRVATAFLGLGMLTAVVFFVNFLWATLGAPAFEYADARGWWDAVGAVPPVALQLLAFTLSLVLFVTFSLMLGLGAGEIINRLMPTRLRRLYAEQVLITLVALREQGVALRNELLADSTEPPPMASRIREWERAVHKEMAKLSKVDARLHQTLDTFPVRFQVSAFAPERSRELNMLSERLERLARFIRDLNSVV